MKIVYNKKESKYFSLFIDNDSFVFVIASQKFGGPLEIPNLSNWTFVKIS